MRGLGCRFSSAENMGEIENTGSSSWSRLGCGLWKNCSTWSQCFCNLFGLITKWNLVYGALHDSQPSPHIKRTSCSKKNNFPRAVPKKKFKRRPKQGLSLWLIAWMYIWLLRVATWYVDRVFSKAVDSGGWGGVISGWLEMYTPVHCCTISVDRMRIVLNVGISTSKREGFLFLCRGTCIFTLTTPPKKKHNAKTISFKEKKEWNYMRTYLILLCFALFHFTEVAVFVLFCFCKLKAKRLQLALLQYSLLQWSGTKPSVLKVVVQDLAKKEASLVVVAGTGGERWGRRYKWNMDVRGHIPSLPAPRVSTVRLAWWAALWVGELSASREMWEICVSKGWQSIHDHSCVASRCCATPGVNSLPT